MKNKIAIYYDSLIAKGGGARVVLELAQTLNADIITCEVDDKLKNWIPKDIKIISTGSFFKSINLPFFYLFELPVRFFFLKNHGYELNIFVGTYSMFAAKNTTNNVWLCFSPNRVMYDLQEWKMKHSTFINRLFLSLHVLLYKQLDNWVVRNNLDLITAQNITINNRIKKYYGKDSLIIHSPVNVNNYSFQKVGDFYLTVSRLMPEKRISLIVEAFNQMPDKKLVIVGNGPERNLIISKIAKNKNISLLTNVEDATLQKLYAECFATVYMPLDEDFGLVPIESMASGKICIAANEGGCRETIINGKTGFLIQPTISRIVETISNLSKEQVLHMKNDCIQQAKYFDLNTFKIKWKVVADYYLQNTDNPTNMNTAPNNYTYSLGHKG